MAIFLNSCVIVLTDTKKQIGKVDSLYRFIVAHMKEFCLFVCCRRLGLDIFFFNILYRQKVLLIRNDGD